MTKFHFAAIAGLAFLAACDSEPEVVAVEPVEDEEVLRSAETAESEGLDAREDVDAIVTPDADPAAAPQDETADAM